MNEVHLDDEIMPFGSLDKTGLGWNCFEFGRRCRIDSVLLLPYGVPVASGGMARRELPAMDWTFDLRMPGKHGLILSLLLLAASSGGAQPGVVRVPFRAVNSLILVEAKVNGQSVTLLLDTGANSTILDAKAYGIAHLPVSPPVNRGPGIVGNALRLRVDLEIANQFLFSQQVSVMNLDELAQRFGFHFAGLLGQDILNQFRSVRIDYKTHTIELEP
jgi:hypothetical protein